jgi:hypothetical protein
LDAQAMLEVNREAIYAAARQQRQQGVESPFVVSVATFGRGIRQEVLQALQGYRFSWGHNQSLVALPPREIVARLLKQPDWSLPASDGDRFWVMGYALGKSHVVDWRWEDEVGDALF